VELDCSSGEDGDGAPGPVDDLGLEQDCRYGGGGGLRSSGSSGSVSTVGPPPVFDTTLDPPHANA